MSAQETTPAMLSVLVFHEGGGLIFVREDGGRVAVLKAEGTEALTDTLPRLGTCNVEHAAQVAREIGGRCQ